VDVDEWPIILASISSLPPFMTHCDAKVWRVHWYRVILGNPQLSNALASALWTVQGLDAG
jgi:hypothetical protein